jgi:drug/metabolite transporter (DMT)-like permease
MSRPVYLLLVLLFCLTWSSAFPTAKLAISTAPPLLFLGLRFLLAAGILLGWAAWRGELARERSGGPIPWLALLGLGLLNQAGYQGLTWIAMGSVSAGLATIITSLNPIMVGAFALPLLGEPLTPRKLAGLVLGFLGAAFVVRNRVVLAGEDVDGILLLFAGMVSVTFGTLLFKRLAPRAALPVIVGVQQLGAAIAVLGVGLATEPVAAVHVNALFLFCMGWFVLVVSIGAFLLWFLLLRRGTASSASSLHFLMPPLGLLMSWAMLGEKLEILDLVGIVPVALGIWLATSGPATPAPVTQRQPV